MAKRYTRTDDELDSTLTSEEQGLWGNRNVAKDITLDGETFVLTFNDEFSHDQTQFWNGHGKNGIWATSFSPHLEDTRTISANNEDQYYVDPDMAAFTNPFTVENGAMHIRATALDAEQSALADGASYSSGLLTTEMSFGTQKGYIEIRADVPDEAGLWSSFWLLPTKGSWSSEVDVFEIRGADPDTVYTNLWDAGSPDSKAITGIDAGDGFHTYGLMWTDEKLQWYIDGELVRETAHTLNDEMFLAISLAVGGFGGDTNSTTDLNDSLAIDYVRVYELESDPARNIAIEPGKFRSQERKNGDDDAETLYGSRWDDHITAEDGDDIIYGRAGDDTIYGGQDKDELYGGKGDDFLSGDKGNDKIIGGDGADVIRGGGGKDHLWGSGYSGGRADADTFFFAKGSGKDFVHDFETGHDTVDLSSFNIDWTEAQNALTDLGWATKISLSDIGGNGSDMVYLMGINKADLGADNFDFGDIVA